MNGLSSKRVFALGSSSLLIFAGLIAGAACNLVTGVDDFQFGGRATGGLGGGGTAGTGGVGGVAGSGGLGGNGGTGGVMPPCGGCQLDKVCIVDTCIEYVQAQGCDTCPCADCAGDFPLCCTHPDTQALICLSHDSSQCP
ncbi:MAG: hypothetical protein U0271_02525 [Polyangiaceae bacterium]